ATLSPSLTCHLASLPSSIVGESAGMVMLMLMASAPVGHGIDRRDDLVDARQRQLLEIGGIGHGHVLAGDARRRGVEVVEGLGDNTRGEFGADAALRPALLHRH